MSPIKTVFPFIISLIFMTGFVHAQTSDKALLVKQIDSILNSQVNNDKIPGAVIEIKQGGNVIMEQAYGYAQKYDYKHRLLAKPDAMTVGTMFDIASLTRLSVQPLPLCYWWRGA